MKDASQVYDVAVFWLIVPVIVTVVLVLQCIFENNGFRNIGAYRVAFIGLMKLNGIDTHIGFLPVIVIALINRVFETVDEAKRETQFRPP